GGRGWERSRATIPTEDDEDEEYIFSEGGGGAGGETVRRTRRSVGKLFQGRLGSSEVRRVRSASMSTIGVGVKAEGGGGELMRRGEKGSGTDVRAERESRTTSVAAVLMPSLGG
ncbi:unnamed protein product, partial [Discosporangium mesarthrocarpum]